MTTQTELIVYNVRERGRKARGQDRNFDTVALAKLINGASVQEKVKHGDMHGYYGHWPRMVLGMEPTEGGIVDGKVISIPPALRTIELRADPDGTIYHRAEFLDTNEGKVAAKLYNSKTGGFSSAIDALPGTTPAIASRFCGFDYVLEPNYTTNRGHKVVLDGVERDMTEREEMMALLDSAVGESIGAAAAMGAMFDALQAQHMRALESLERVSAENYDLIGRLSRGRSGVVLDSVRQGPALGEQVPDYGRFRAMPLVPLQEAAREETTEDRYLKNRFGIEF